MTKYYNVWIEIEEVDEDLDHYQNVQDQCVKLATLPTLEAAIGFAESLQHDQEQCNSQLPCGGLWGVNHVREVRPDLETDQALAVLRRVDENHTATAGINWDVIAYHARELFPDSDQGGDE